MFNKIKVLEKAKKTRYKHKDWYRGTDRSVYSVMKEMAEKGDFGIDFPKTYRSINQLNKIGYDGERNPKAVKEWLIRTGQYDKLVLRFYGSEGGTDKGKLKIQTFLIFKNY